MKWKYSLLVGKTIIDDNGQRWKIGKFVGAGTFARVHEVCRVNNEGVVDESKTFIIKWEKEPGTENGFDSEIKFSKKVASKNALQRGKRALNLDFIGIPEFVASGTHQWKRTNFKFLITSKLGKSLSEFIKEKPGKRLAVKVLLALVLQIIDVLQYLHFFGVVHNDIKADNILLDMDKLENEGKIPKIYLVDYGLSREFKESMYPNESLQLWGTRHYMARDAHKGAYPRRGDLESLAYNMIIWAGGILPWELIDEAKPNVMFELKTKFIKALNVRSLSSSRIEGLSVLKEFLRYVRGLKPEDAPDYSKCREILRKGLSSNGKQLNDASPRELNTRRRKRTLCEDEVSAPAKKLKLVKTNRGSDVFKHQAPMLTRNKARLLKEQRTAPDADVPAPKRRKASRPAVTNRPQNFNAEAKTNKKRSNSKTEIAATATLTRSKTRLLKAKPTAVDIPARKQTQKSLATNLNNGTTKKNRINTTKVNASAFVKPLQVHNPKVKERQNNFAAPKIQKKQPAATKEITHGYNLRQRANRNYKNWA